MLELLLLRWRLCVCVRVCVRVCVFTRAFHFPCEASTFVVG
jgi:hypothetical protein